MAQMGADGSDAVWVIRMNFAWTGLNGIVVVGD